MTKRFSFGSELESVLKGRGGGSGKSDDPGAFQGKDAYVELFDKVRTASLAALDDYAESDLDNPAPENFRNFCPTMGDMFTLIATHPMMHAGQFVIVRRQLGKPILM